MDHRQHIQISRFQVSISPFLTRYRMDRDVCLQMSTVSLYTQTAMDLIEQSTRKGLTRSRIGGLSKQKILTMWKIVSQKKSLKRKNLSNHLSHLRFKKIFTSLRLKKSLRRLLMYLITYHCHQSRSLFTKLFLRSTLRQVMARYMGHLIRT